MQANYWEKVKNQFLFESDSKERIKHAWWRLRNGMNPREASSFPYFYEFQLSSKPRMEMAD